MNKSTSFVTCFSLTYLMNCWWSAEWPCTHTASGATGANGLHQGPFQTGTTCLKSGGTEVSSYSACTIHVTWARKIFMSWISYMYWNFVCHSS